MAFMKKSIGQFIKLRIGLYLCNALRACGALSGFFVAYFSLKFAGASQYGLFLFSSSLIGFIPEYFSQLAYSEYLNRYSSSLALDRNKFDVGRYYSRYQDFFNLFLISCSLSALLPFALPVHKLGIDPSLGIFVSLFVCLRQYLLIISEKLRLSLSAPFADFIQYLCPPLTNISILSLLHFSAFSSRLNSAGLALSSALAYLLPLALIAYTPALKRLFEENLYSLLRWPAVLKKYVFSRSSSSIFIGDLSLAAMFGHFVARLPTLFIGYFSSEMAYVAVYGVLQRIQYLVLIPGYSFISFNARSVAVASANQNHRRFIVLFFGVLLVSTASAGLFWVLYALFPDHLGWLFSKKGVGITVDQSLLLL